MQSILAALSDELPQLGTTADKINEIAIGHITSVSVSIEQPPAYYSLEWQTAQLTKQVTDLAAVVYIELFFMHSFLFT